MDQKRFGKELERGFNSFVFKGQYYFAFILLLLIEMGDGLARKIVPENYNKDFRPGLKEGKPLEVFFSMRIGGIQEVNLNKKSLKLKMLLQVSWTDERLLFPYEEFNKTRFKEKTLGLESDFLEEIWTPDHFFRSVNQIQKLNFLRNSLNVQLDPRKKIITSSLYVLNIDCPMNFRYYPFDTQVCHIHIGSYFYTKNEVKFTWDKSGFIVDESMNKKLIDYEATWLKHNETTCFSKLFYPEETACLRLVLTLKRYYWVYLITFFIPSSLIVMVSWLSFFYPSEMVSIRTILVVRSLLMISSLFSASRAKSPRTYYANGIDTWMCFTIISGVFPIFHYAVVLKFSNLKKLLMDDKVYPLKSSSTKLKKILRYDALQKATELVGRIGLPICVFIFNVCYWPNYTGWFKYSGLIN